MGHDSGAVMFGGCDVNRVNVIVAFRYGEDIITGVFLASEFLLREH
jgi:hypothetical protein